MTDHNRSKSITSASANDVRGFDLIDEANSQMAGCLPELEAQKKIASDKSQPIKVRLKAYDGIFESEIGDTIFARARNIERAVGLRQLYLKFEGNNPTGTQKDRIAFVHVRDALRREFDAITLATCGNYGTAMAFASYLAGLRCIIHIPDSYHTQRCQEMTDYGAEIVRVQGDYERSVEVSKEFAARQKMYDANPGGVNTILQQEAYGTIAYEIYDILKDAPGFVAIPVSNGTTLAGLYKGFVSLYRRGKTTRIPRMIAGSSYGKNPIIHAFQKKMPHCTELDPEKIRETAVNEPLINWQSLDGDDALEAVRLSRGWAAYASDKKMLDFARLIHKQEGLNVLPASTAGLIALLDLQTKVNLANDCYVLLLTGRQ